MSTGNMMNGDSCGGGSFFTPQEQNPRGRFNHHQQQSYDRSPMFQIAPYDAFSVLEEYEQRAKMPMVENGKGEQSSFSASDTFDADGRDDGGRGRDSLCHRMKWTEQMIKLLITVLSYLGEDAVSEYDIGRKGKMSIVQEKGKWKLVSKVMAERGCYASPQQCEDKFNDLNKRYKRLTDILGRGTSCEVVENPALLEHMPHLSEKAKDDARKILSSKHLFYEVMCSYNNGNRLNLPADPSVERSLQLALKSGDSVKSAQDGVDDDVLDLDADCDYNLNDTMEHSTIDEDIGGICCPKKMKDELEFDDVSFASSFSTQACSGKSPIQDISINVHQKYREDHPSSQLQKQCMRSRSLQLEEKRLQIEAQLLELEKRRFIWQRFSRKKDRELDKLRLDNEKIRLENERLTWELKCKEQEISIM